MRHQNILFSFLCSHPNAWFVSKLNFFFNFFCWLISRPILLRNTLNIYLYLIGWDKFTHYLFWTFCYVGNELFSCLIDWGCWTNRQHLRREVRLPNEYPGYDIKQSDGEVLNFGKWWVPLHCHCSQVYFDPVL